MADEPHDKAVKTVTSVATTPSAEVAAKAELPIARRQEA